MSRRSGPGCLELTPDPSWAWDGDDWLNEADRQLMALGGRAEATTSAATVVIAEAGATPASWFCP